MDCAKTVELLPWYANGTLEPEIEQLVARHVADCESCAHELAETKQAFEVFGQHLPTDYLTGLADGSLDSAVDRDPVERHLQQCQSCSEALDLVRRSLQALDDRAEILPFAPTRRRPSRTSQYLALAASLVAMVTTTLALWSWRELAVREAQIAELRPQNRPAETVVSEPPDSTDALDELRQQTEDLRAIQRTLEDSLVESRSTSEALRSRLSMLDRPLINATVVDLFPAGTVTRSPAESDEIVIPAGEPGVVVILNSALEAITVPTRVRLARADEVLWELGGVTRNPTGDFTLTLSNQGLDPGTYVIELLGEHGVVLESFRLRAQ